ncbi:MAG TPA: hypothetical protein VMB05_09135 [Solirubrobacteraceae bacterium]|nr:hypothetical protein [Solirubrobacteraceae bacterium]
MLLSEDDGQRRWSRMELRQGMGVGEDDFARAIDGLLDAGVLQQEHDYVWPSPSTRRLDALELIGV